MRRRHQAPHQTIPRDRLGGGPGGRYSVNQTKTVWLAFVPKPGHRGPGFWLSWEAARHRLNEGPVSVRWSSAVAFRGWWSGEGSLPEDMPVHASQVASHEAQTETGPGSLSFLILHTSEMLVSTPTSCIQHTQTRLLPQEPDIQLPSLSHCCTALKRPPRRAEPEPVIVCIRKNPARSAGASR